MLRMAGGRGVRWTRETRLHQVTGTGALELTWRPVQRCRPRSASLGNPSAIVERQGGIWRHEAREACGHVGVDGCSLLLKVMFFLGYWTQSWYWDAGAVSVIHQFGRSGHRRMVQKAMPASHR